MMADKLINDSVCLRSFRSRTEAEMIQSMLASKHIRSFVLGDDAGGMYPPLLDGIKLYVNQKDKQKAMEIINI